MVSYNVHTRMFFCHGDVFHHKFHDSFFTTVRKWAKQVKRGTEQLLLPWVRNIDLGTGSRQFSSLSNEKTLSAYPRPSFLTRAILSWYCRQCCINIIIIPGVCYAPK